eukprot:3225548-Ditylum_brightwellii.AAC.2
MPDCLKTASVSLLSQKKNVNGMTVKLTTTINAAGQVAAIYITVKCLSMSEIPLREDVEASVPGSSPARGSIVET